MTLSDVLTILDAIAPFDTAEEWDNSGLQIGDPSSRVGSILVALDATVEVIEKAAKTGVELIVTHHPLLMAPVRMLDLADGLGRKVAMLMEGRINLVSMHTNLDKAPGGTADSLAGLLGLDGVRSQGFLRAGSLKTPSNLWKWLGTLSLVSFPAITRVCDAGREVRIVGACPGGGMDYWMQAKRLGCDTFVTGDVRYHAALDALESGMNVVDLGHFRTEEIVLKPLADRLRMELNGVEVLAHCGRDVFSSPDHTNRGEGS
jgi:dinuclear metal center YbgI/SA1388 family protein